jgi:hypothetical protein
MKSSLKTFLLANLVLLSSGQSTAYELATHAKMINFAYGKSLLGAPDSSIQKRLGIDAWVLGSDTGAAPFRAGSSDFYYDIAQGQVAVRQPKSYELKIMTDIGQKDEVLTVRGWLMRGGIREDDGGLIAGARNNEPFDDPVSNFNRFCNHFLDPVSTHGSTGRGFSGFCFFESPISDAAQWALGSQNPFDAQPAENMSRRNHFSVLDARDLMWRALTLRDKAGSDVPKNGFTPEQLRKIYWASTFRSLGDVVHLLQDQAQPQHTRNEGHGYSNKGYEEYIDARATQARQFTIDEQKLTSLAGQLPDLNYDGYAIPRFSRYSDYWSTRVNSSNIYGLSDYSNRGFFTVEKNFGNTIYPEPSSDISKYSVYPVFLSTWGGSFKHLVGQVEDKLTGASESVTMSTQSIFTGLVANGGAAIPPKYTLSKKNYDDRAALLIPRAVGYSAGLIDYFFRGEMKIFAPTDFVYAIVDHADPASNCKDNCGFKKLKVRVANSTPDITVSGGGGAVPQGMTGGTLVLVAKYKTNTCYTSDLEGEYDSSKSSEDGRAYYERCVSANEEITVSDAKTVPGVPACNNAVADDCKTKSQQFVFDFQKPIPINAANLYLQMVYRGKLGDEADAVVVETLDITEPTYMAIANITDYLVCYQQKWYFKSPNGDLPPEIPPGNVLSLGPAVHRISNFTFGTYASVAPTTLGYITLDPREFVRVAVLTDAQGGWVIDNRQRGISALQRTFNMSGAPDYTITDGKNPLRRVRADALFYFPPGVVNCPAGEEGPATQPNFPPYLLPIIKPVTINF